MSPKRRPPDLNFRLACHSPAIPFFHTSCYYSVSNSAILLMEVHRHILYHHSNKNKSISQLPNLSSHHLSHCIKMYACRRSKSTLLFTLFLYGFNQYHLVSTRRCCSISLSLQGVSSKIDADERRW